MHPRVRDTLRIAVLGNAPFVLKLGPVPAGPALAKPEGFESEITVTSAKSLVNAIRHPNRIRTPTTRPKGHLSFGYLVLNSHRMITETDTSHLVFYGASVPRRKPTKGSPIDGIPQTTLPDETVVAIVRTSERLEGTVKNLAHFSDSLISPPSGAATPPAESRPDSASSPTRSRPRT